MQTENSPFFNCVLTLFIVAVKITLFFTVLLPYPTVVVIVRFIL